jgi:ubiquinone/menaquinone biosynthesis C-methylase UbiE
MSTPTTFDRSYAGSAAQNYERYFVPVLGEPVARALIGAANVQPGERVLDVGCGTGVVARLAAERAGAGKVVAADPNAGMLEAARAAAPSALGIEWHEAPGESLPFPDASFDVVVSSLALQFFTDRVQGLREMRRVLAEGGRACITTPGQMPPPFALMEQSLAQHLGPEAGGFLRAVFSLGDAREMERLVRAADFHDVSVEAITAPLELPPTAEFVWQYIMSTPLSVAAANLTPEARAALERDMVAKWKPFTDESGGIKGQISVVLARAKK